MSTKRSLIVGLILAVVMLFAALPGGKVEADWSTFDNPDYYYADITSAPVGTYYRAAGFNPDGTKIVAQKAWGTQMEIVLMNSDGSGEVVISPGDSGTGDIYGYLNPFWSDDGTTIGFVEVHNANPNKVIAYDLATSIRSYIYEPASPNDVSNPDFLGGSKTSIVFWAYGDVGGADLWTWDGSTLTNITDTDDYKEYEPVSNGDGSIILYWSGESTAEPVNTTHTLTNVGGTWTKDVGFSPIADTYWSYWTTPAATQIATTIMSSKDLAIYDNTGAFVDDLTGAGYSGGSGQWNFFGSMPQGPDGEFAITSNAGRGTTAGRDIVIANPRILLYVSTTGSDDNPGTENAPFATIGKAVAEAIDGTTIHVAAGTYPENINVNKSLTILGTGNIETFVDPVVLSDTQAPDTWYKDRYAPGVFATTTFLGEEVLQHGIRAVDLQTSAFYNTQGRKYDINLTGPTQTVSIDMFVGEDWDTQTRYSGLWATGFDGAEAISAYPILAWRNAEGDGPGFFAYDYLLGGWLKLRDASPDDYGKWHTLEFTLTVGTGIDYFVDGEYFLSFADPDTVSLGNVILNVKNYGEDYDVYWDNFAAHDSKVVGQVSINASNVVVNGLIFSNPGQAYGMLIDDLVSNVDLTENIFMDIGSQLLTANVKGIYLQYGPDDILIKDNLFERIHAKDKSVNAIFSGDSNSTSPAEELIIQDNRFLNITSATKGGYGILLNNGAGNPGALIDGNRFTGISGGWTHAVGMEGPTLDAKVTGNTFYNLSALSIDNSAVLFEVNPVGNTVEVSGNRFFNIGYGVAIHPNDLPGGLNGLDYTVDATLNYWGSSCGPSAAAADAGPNVIYSPWYTDVALSGTCSGVAGSFVFPTVGSTTESMNAIIACAAPGSTLTFEGGTYPGGLVVGPEKYELTFELNGATVGVGSSSFLIFGNDIVINGPGVIDGTGGVVDEPGIAVFGDNFILDGVELKNVQGGAVVVPEPVESLKIVNNWFHDNWAGLQVQQPPTGVVTIKGNLFKENGMGVDYVGLDMLDATYNSWGNPAGPGGQAGTYVNAVPFNYYEIYFDMDPSTGDEDTWRRVAVSETFDVALKADAVDVYGLSFKFTYDPDQLVLNLTTFDAAWLNKCTQIGTPPTGTVEYFCNLTSGDSEWDGGTIATFNFTALESAVESFFDIFTELPPITTEPVSPTAGAVGGVKVWVNNAGYNDPFGHGSVTDGDDGALTIDGIAQFTGFVDLEGRPNDSGALLQVFDAASGGVLKATALSVSSGKYTTVYETGMWMVVSTVDPAYSVPYYLQFDRALFLSTPLMEKTLTQEGLTTLALLKLLGGDATDDEFIDVSDAACIGGAYLGTPALCGTVGWNDVNEDGVIDIYDLTLMGGNFNKNYSPWAP